MTDNKQYWEQRFNEEGMIWGESPSKTAFFALDIFRRQKIKSILIPGSGYGRNSKLFSSSGYLVTGIEISEKACNMSREFDPGSKFLNETVLDMSFDAGKYDAIYCFNVLHLFRRDDRKKFLEECRKKLKENGLAFFTVFSNEESSFGQGKEVEENTFETRPGRPAHYYTETDLVGEFSDFKIIETGSLQDPEDHGGKPHVHTLRYILAEK